MIIACPNCTKPYQLPDEQVAPLVQVQCAHCDYRVILDFEAANDPSLREPGMLLADGFRSEADYNSALADGHSVTKHELPAAPPKSVAKPVAKPAVPTTPPATARTAQTAASRPSAVPQATTRPKSAGLVSGLGLPDTPGSLAAAVTEHDKAEPEPEVVAEPVKAAEPEVKAPEPEIKAPEAAEPEVKAAEPEVKAAEPEVKAAEPEVKAAEPEVKAAEPEVKATEPEPAKVKDAEPEKAVTTPTEEEGKGSGPFWIILIVLVILIFVVTYATTGQFNPAQLLQPGK